jgi:glutathione S-transferase
VLTLYFAPRTRAVRVRWLLEELGLPHELRRVEFQRPVQAFAQLTPLGKLPVIEDNEVVICESGAIVEYVLERYGDGRLAPPIGSPLRGLFLQWVHFAEATAFPPLGVIVWHLVYQGDADANPGAMAGARERANASLEFVEHALGANDYLVGNAFSAADVMMGFTLLAARLLGVLDPARFPRLNRYLERLEARPAFQRANAT